MRSPSLRAARAKRRRREERREEQGRAEQKAQFSVTGRPTSAARAVGGFERATSTPLISFLPLNQSYGGRFEAATSAYIKEREQTADRRQLPWFRCRRRVAIVAAASAPRRRGADAAPPRPIAAASRRGAEAPPREVQRHSVAVVHGTCLYKNFVKHRETPRRELNRRPPDLTT